MAFPDQLDLVKHLPPSAEIEQVIQRITDIFATAANNSDIIKVSARATDPGLAASAANAYAEAYVDLRKQGTLESLRDAARRLEAKVAEVDEQLAATSNPRPAVSNRQDCQLLMARQSALQGSSTRCWWRLLSAREGYRLGHRPSLLPSLYRPARPERLAGGRTATGAGLGVAFPLDQLDDRSRGKTTSILSWATLRCSPWFLRNPVPAGVTVPLRPVPSAEQITSARRHTARCAQRCSSPALVTA